MPDSIRLTDVLNRLENAEHLHEENMHVTVGEILSVFEDRSFGPLLFLLGLAQVVAGIIPFVSDSVAVISMFIAVQMVLNLQHPWFPKSVLNLRLTKDRLHKIVHRMRPWVERGDKIFRKRCSFFVTPPARWIAGLLSLLLGFLVYLVGWIPIPGMASIPSLGLVAFGIGLTTRDGLVMFIGLVAVIGSTFLGVWATVTVILPMLFGSAG
ncbi:MAG: exopolysaccharide biosynthesis protein [Verrucomicrobiota bacterium]